VTLLIPCPVSYAGFSDSASSNSGRANPLLRCIKKLFHPVMRPRSHSANVSSPSQSRKRSPVNRKETINC
jgi:hypothetical protein